MKRLLVVVVATLLGNLVVSAGEQALATAKITAGFVSAIEVVKEGSGYLKAPAVSIVGPTGSGATAVAVVTAGRVTAIVVTSAGSGYTSMPAVVVAPPPKDTAVKIRHVPAIEISGEPGTAQVVQWSPTIGPDAAWKPFTSVILGTNPVISVDLTTEGSTRYYRAVPASNAIAPVGFIYLAGGEFQMGSPVTEPGRDGDELLHTVVLTKEFWLSSKEVTQAQFRAIMATNQSYFKGDDLPADSVSWEDAMAYCGILTRKEWAEGRLPVGYAYRLPTEAEWEYACRAGSTTAYEFGAELAPLVAFAWVSSSAQGKTHPVGTKEPNKWGFYDMQGNVAEWCLDWYGGYTVAAVDPSGATPPPEDHLFRGSHWAATTSLLKIARSAKRFIGNPIGGTIGFRPALIRTR